MIMGHVMSRFDLSTVPPVTARTAPWTAWLTGVLMGPTWTLATAIQNATPAKK